MDVGTVTRQVVDVLPIITVPAGTERELLLMILLLVVIIDGIIRGYTIVVNKGWSVQRAPRSGKPGHHPGGMIAVDLGGYVLTGGVRFSSYAGALRCKWRE